MRTNRLTRILIGALLFFIFAFTLHPSPFTQYAYAASKGADSVAYWRFDEGGGPTAYDESSNNKDGTLNAGAGGTNTAVGQMWSRQGKIGGALELDGTDDYAQMSYVPNMTNNALTVCAWIKPNDVSGTEEILNQDQWDGGPWTGWRFQKVGSGITFKLGDNTSNVYSHTAGTLLAGVWQYVVGVWDGSYIRIYIDGKEVGSASKTFTYVGNTGSHYIGKYSGAAYYFQGLIDDVRVYNYARTPEQILVDYNAGSAAHLGAGTDPNEGNPPVAYWTMDENTGTTAYDRSGNGFNGTLYNTPTWVNGKRGAALQFNGTNQYVSLADNDSLDSFSAITVEVWVKLGVNPDSPNEPGGRYATIVGKSIDDGYQLRMGSADSSTAGKFNFGVKTGGTFPQVTTTEAYGTGVWYHVAATYDGTNIKVYINGEVKGSGTSSGSLPNTTNAIEIGRRPNGYYFAGNIDDVKIYNYARTQAQIAYDYNKAKPVAYYKFDEGGGVIAHNEYSSADTGGAPVGWWRLDEGAGTSVTDSSGNGLSGTASAATWTAGKVGPYGLNNANVTISDNALLEGMSSLTIGAWVYPTALAGTDREMVTKGAWNSSPPMSYRLMYQTDWGSGSGYPNGYWQFHIKTSAGEYTVVGPNGVSSTRINMWHYLVGVYDGAAGKVRIYDNGALLAETNAAGTINTNDYNTMIWSAASGIIDDVRIYNYARTAEQIYNDYTTTHGTLAGDAKFVDGKIGKALNFDGVDDYVKITKDDKWQSQDTTIEAWVKPSASQPDTYNGIIGCHGEGSPSQRGWVIQQDSSTANKYYFSYGDGTAWQGDPTTLYAQLTANVWQYIAVTKSGTSLVIYVNGIVVDTHTATNASILYGTGDARPDLYIGDFYGGNRSFNGLIDDVHIYNYARTQEQVLQDYNAGSPARLGAQSAGVADPWGGALPVGYWKLDENTGVLANDASGNGNNGTLTNGPTWIQGKNGTALSFDGVDDYVKTASATALDGNGGPKTVSAWIYHKDSDQDRIVGIFQSAGSSQPQYALFTTGINLRIQLVNQAGTFFGDITSTAAFSLNAWHHVAFTYDETNLIFYIDGVSESHPLSGDIRTDASPAMYIGIRGDFPATERFNGYIDDVKIYNYVRTPAQIAWDYNAGKPIGHWRFDEVSGTACYDDTGNNNGTATIGGTGSQTTIAAARTNGATGKFGRCMSFDGTDDYVQITTTASLNATFNGTASFTVCQWVNFGGSNGYYPSFNKGTVNTGLTIHGIDGRIQGGDGTNSFDRSGMFGESLIGDGWRHVAITYDGSIFRGYLNGLAVATYNWTNGIGNTSSYNVKIGSFWGPIYQGLIDDVRIYNYARTAEQIQQDYLNGASARLGD